MLSLERFSFGVGDRFAHQAKAQLHAFQILASHGVSVAPVWNKSNREHTFVGSEPQSVYDAAKHAVSSLAWNQPWHVDADHIRIETVDRFIPSSDFFTLDVADSIAKPASSESVHAFLNRHPELIGAQQISGLSVPFTTTRADIERIISKYLLAVQEAGKIYRHIASKKGEGNFIAEQIALVPAGASTEQVATMVMKIRNQFGIQEVSLFNMQRNLILTSELKPKKYFPSIR
mgnify:CR=1 FL=1